MIGRNLWIADYSSIGSSSNNSYSRSDSSSSRGSIGGEDDGDSEVGPP